MFLIPLVYLAVYILIGLIVAACFSSLASMKRSAVKAFVAVIGFGGFSCLGWVLVLSLLSLWFPTAHIESSLLWIVGGVTYCIAGLAGSLFSLKFFLSMRKSYWRGKQDASFIPGGKGSHLRIFINGKTSVLPMHSKELGKGLVHSIKKQIGLK